MSELAATWQRRAQRRAVAWGLTRISWLRDVSTAHVAHCHSPHGPAILKVSRVAGMIELEERALCHFGFDLCPRVFEFSAEDEAMLIERIGDSTDMTGLYPNPEAEIEVWFPMYSAVVSNPGVPEGFPTLAEFAEIFDRVAPKSPSAAVSHILKVAAERRGILNAAPEARRLLHGDMHHFNFLRASDGGWKLIDPHGVVGNPLYELGAFLRNPFPASYTEPGVIDRLRTRIDLLAERMNLPAITVAEFGFFGAAFSIAWDIEFEDYFFDGMISLGNACLDLATRG